MYDRNGLELSPVAETVNSYKYTSIDRKNRKWNAYARGAYRSKTEFTMHNFAKFKDPRDAAFVAQTINKQFTKDQIREMVIDGTFQEIMNDFVSELEIPQWQYPAEGLDFDDIECDYGYTVNRVDSARDALVEAFKVFGIRAPAIALAKLMIQEVQKRYDNGCSYREAARTVVFELESTKEAA